VTQSGEFGGPWIPRVFRGPIPTAGRSPEIIKLDNIETAVKLTLLIG